jgi:hypothetical protein
VVKKEESEEESDEELEGGHVDKVDDDSDEEIDSDEASGIEYISG